MATRGSNLVRRYTFAEVATYTTAGPDAAATWTHIPIEGTPEGTREMATDAAAVSNARGNDSMDYPTVRRGALSGLVVPAFGGNVAFDGAAGDSPPTSFYLQKMFEHYFGADAVSAAGTTTTSTGIGSAGDPLDVTSATGLVVGMALEVNGEFRVITGISTNAITLDQDLSAAPAPGDVVYASWMVKPTLGELAEYLYISEELANGEGYLYMQGKPNALQLTGLAAGNGLKWTLGFESNDFEEVPVVPNTFTPNAFTAQPPVVASADVSVAGTSTCISDGSVDFGVKHEWRACATAVNGRDGMEIIGCSPTVNVTEYFSSSRLSQFTGRAGLNVRLAFTNGSSNLAKARHAIVVWMPNAQCNTAGAAIGNIRGMSTTFLGRDPTTAQIAAGVTAPIYLSIFGGRA
jgi:hypothetical protein